MHKVLELKNDVSQVPVLGEWIEMLGEELSLPMPAVFQLNLALEEAVVNVMNYAYGTQKDMPVLLTVDVEEGGNGDIRFELIDEGVPFDPTKAEAPDVTLSAEERNIGGLGIFLVQQLMHQVEYSRQGNKNILCMVYRPGKVIDNA